MVPNLETWLRACLSTYPKWFSLFLGVWCQDGPGTLLPVFSQAAKTKGKSLVSLSAQAYKYFYVLHEIHQYR